MGKEYAKVVCIGIGGCGCRNVDLLHKIYEYDIDKYILMDTDSKCLQDNIREAKNYMSFVRNIRSIIIGDNNSSVTDPEQGYQKAMQKSNEIMELLQNVDVVFILAGFGGASGTGASIALASCLKAKGIKLIGIVTMPFKFEGEKRRQIADEYLEKLKQCADNVVVFENEELFMDELSAKASEMIKLRYTNYSKSFREAFPK